MIYHISRISRLGYSSLWRGEPTLTFSGIYPVFRKNDDCDLIAQTMYGFEAMFPKLVIPGEGGLMRVEVIEAVERPGCYFIQEMKI